MYDSLGLWLGAPFNPERSEVTLTIVKGKTSSGTLADNLERWFKARSH